MSKSTGMSMRIIAVEGGQVDWYVDELKASGGVRKMGRGIYCIYAVFIVHGQRAKLGGVLEKGSKGYNLAL